MESQGIFMFMIYFWNVVFGNPNGGFPWRFPPSLFVQEQRLVLQAAAMAAQPATRKASDAFNDGASDATTEAAEGVGWVFLASLSALVSMPSWLVSWVVGFRF